MLSLSLSALSAWRGVMHPPLSYTSLTLRSVSYPHGSTANEPISFHFVSFRFISFCFISFQESFLRSLTSRTASAEVQLGLTRRRRAVVAAANRRGSQSPQQWRPFPPPREKWKREREKMRSKRLFFPWAALLQWRMCLWMRGEREREGVREGEGQELSAAAAGFFLSLMTSPCALPSCQSACCASCRFE